MERACIECKKVPAADQYYDIDIGRVCRSCFNDNSADRVVKPTFTKKVCLYHKCSTYNSNQMGAHEMPWCDIVAVQTVGVQKPNTQYDETLGGMNGNIGRHYYKDWTEFCQQKDKLIHAQKDWAKYRRTFGRKRPQSRGKSHAY